MRRNHSSSYHLKLQLLQACLLLNLVVALISIVLQVAYVGEAHFWRAFAHYYLLTNFRQVSPIRQMPRGAEDYVRKPEKSCA